MNKDSGGYMNMKPEICPWCRKKPKITKEGFTDEDGCMHTVGYRVECSKHPHHHSVKGPVKETRVGAIFAWNHEEAV